MASLQNSEGSAEPQSRLGITRRQTIVGLGLATAGAAGAALATWWNAHRPIEHHGFSLKTPKSADEALARLRAGNECYIEEHFDVGNLARTTARRAEVAPAQHPYAIVLACADSRVPPEVIFSAGLGDLFVVRVAGNIVDPRCLGVLASIEYAIEELKIPLVFVLGHESCGAVKAAIAAVEKGIQPPGAIGVLTDAIRPVLDDVRARTGDFLTNAVEGNVRNQVANLVSSKPIVASAVTAERVQIVGGVYELHTGRVRVHSRPGHL